MLNFGGEVESLSAMMDTVRKDRGWAVDDTDAMVVRFKSGLIGMHSTILTSPPRHDFVQVSRKIIAGILTAFSSWIVLRTGRRHGGADHHRQPGVLLRLDHRGERGRAGAKRSPRRHRDHSCSDPGPVRHARTSSVPLSRANAGVAWE